MRDDDHEARARALASDIMASATIIEQLQQANGLLPLFVGLSEEQIERRLVELYGDRP
ncbi:hypothetical protein JQ636_37950 [Bradyrhizobium japonicum]|uniref:hypothetical protein n=1 Tax=Bradyrhizobium japonicum TaxID=375 RepID=UPI001BABD4AC|nr:hypothetical protein [Bradyrhizobium japonicum]MBR0809347.1 hypothetical protein [Bradyrhizobium japonicum]